MLAASVISGTIAIMTSNFVGIIAAFINVIASLRRFDAIAVGAFVRIGGHATELKRTTQFQRLVRMIKRTAIVMPIANLISIDANLARKLTAEFFRRFAFVFH